MAARRIELDRDDELASRELAAEQSRGAGDVEPGRNIRRHRPDRDGRSTRLGAGRASAVDDFAHRGDVLGRRAAAATDQARTGADHALGVLRHIGG